MRAHNDGRKPPCNSCLVERCQILIRATCIPPETPQRRRRVHPRRYRSLTGKVASGRSQRSGVNELHGCFVPGLKFCRLEVIISLHVHKLQPITLLGSQHIYMPPASGTLSNCYQPALDGGCLDRSRFDGEGGTELCIKHDKSASTYAAAHQTSLTLRPACPTANGNKPNNRGNIRSLIFLKIHANIQSSFQDELLTASKPGITYVSTKFCLMLCMHRNMSAICPSRNCNLYAL